MRDAKGAVHSVRYESLNAMLLNEFLEQHRTVEEQGAEIALLRAKAARVDSLEQRPEKLEQLLNAKN